MLATGFDLCQGTRCVFRREIAQLAAGAEHVAPSALTDEHIEACLSHDGLEGGYAAFRWTAEWAPGKFIKRNQIDFARDPADELGEPTRIVVMIIHPGQQYVLKGESSGWW